MLNCGECEKLMTLVMPFVNVFQVMLSTVTDTLARNNIFRQGYFNMRDKKQHAGHRFFDTHFASCHPGDYKYHITFKFGWVVDCECSSTAVVLWKIGAHCMPAFFLQSFHGATDDHCSRFVPFRRTGKMWQKLNQS